METKFIHKTTFVLLAFTICFCSTTNNQIEQINVEYVDWSSSSVTGPIDCESFDYFLSEHHKEKQFTDKSLLRSVGKQIKSLQKKRIQTEADSMRIDIRIKSYIRYNSGDVDTLCLGPFAYTVLNNQIMKDNKKLTELYQEELYPDLK